MFVSVGNNTAAVFFCRYYTLYDGTSREKLLEAYGEDVSASTALL